MKDEKMSLAEFIYARRSEILEEISALQQELRELKAVENALMEVRVGNFSADIVMPETSYLTIREMAAEVLESQPDGGSANQICKWIREIYGVDVPRPSLSPQLSRLKKEGHVILDPRSKIWQHKKYTIYEDPELSVDPADLPKEAEL